jgi:hypothetical protein
MSRGIEQIGEYIDRLTGLQSNMTGELNVAAAMRMLVVLKCLERALTAYLSKQKL